MVRVSTRRELKFYFFIYATLFVYLLILSLTPTTDITTFIVNEFNIHENEIPIEYEKEIKGKKQTEAILIEDKTIKNLLKLSKEYAEKEYYIHGLDIYKNDSERYIIKRNVFVENHKQIIQNEELFDKVRNDTVIILVQVHNRLPHLRVLIESLSQVKDIEKSLLIFSHSFYSNEINSFVKNISFCPVLQIFFPFSLQIYPTEFPGKNKFDCSERNEENKTCKENADKFGHYRNPKMVQIKHHWWWKANRVFDKLLVTKNHNGYVIFLEEDLYVTPDIIHVLKLVNLTKICPHCNIISLGEQLRDVRVKNSSFRINIAQARPWTSIYNMGMVIDRKTWIEIKECAFSFCTFDDYNWDFSLYHISKSCMKHQLYAFHMINPRVFHLGFNGGTHKQKKTKNQNNTMVNIKKLVKKYNDSIYDNYKEIKLVRKVTKFKNKQIQNGGWGDARDHALCLSFSSKLNNL